MPSDRNPTCASTRVSRSAASTGTPAITRDDEEAASDMLARLQRRLAGTECDIDRVHHARYARERLAEKLRAELTSSAGRVDRLLEGSRPSSKSEARRERDELLMLVAPFGQSSLWHWRSIFKEQHGVEPTGEDLKAWIQGKVEALDYVNAATREAWSEAIDALEVVKTKLAKPTHLNPMVGRGGDCEGCRWILAALERRSSKMVGDHLAYPCTCTTRPPPESVALEPDEVLLRTFDAATDKQKELAVEYLRALKRDDKLEEHLRARAVFVVAQIREKCSANSHRTFELNPSHAAEAGARGQAAQRRAGLGPERYLYSLAERNLDPFSRRCRVVARKLKSTRRIRDYTRFVEETDYTRLKEKTD